MDEKEVKKISKEDQIKTIDDLIEAQKKLQDNYNKAIKELTNDVCPDVLVELGFEVADCIKGIANLKKIKDRILNQGLGNEYAEAAFGIHY